MCIVIPNKTMFLVKIRKPVLVVKEKSQTYQHGIREDTDPCVWKTFLLLAILFLENSKVGIVNTE